MFFMTSNLQLFYLEPASILQSASLFSYTSRHIFGGENSPESSMSRTCSLRHFLWEEKALSSHPKVFPLVGHVCVCVYVWFHKFQLASIPHILQQLFSKGLVEGHLISETVIQTQFHY